MDRFPVVQNGRTMGEMTVSRDGLYDCFSLFCHPEGNGVWRAFAVGECGELRLGIPVPSGNGFALCRRIAAREAAAAGVLNRAELRLCGEAAEDWEAVRNPEELFRDPFLRRRLRGMQHVRVRRENDGFCLALPFERGKPFPLPALFCFARLQCVCGTCCVVYAFDARENPVIR